MERFCSRTSSQLHAKFQKDSWSGFRETAVTDERTDRGDLIGPFGFQPGTNMSVHINLKIKSCKTIF